MFKLDNSLKKRIRKTPKMLPMMKTLLNQSMLKKLSYLLQSQLLPLQNQLFKLPQPPPALIKLNGPKLIKLKLPKQ